MTATATRAAPARWYRNAQAGLAVSAGAGLALLVVGDLDPVHDMVSNAIRTVPGTLLLLTALCGLVVSGAWILTGARRALPRSNLLTVMLTVWCASLIAVAVFPTNLPGTEAGVSGTVHRYGAAVMAVLPPLIGLLVADLAARRAETPRVRTLRAVGLLTLAACVAFGAVNGVPALFGGGLPPYAGLSERLLLVLMLIVVGLSAWVVEGEEG